jgi:Outer membrane lipoprotein-sorting protein
MKLKTLLILTAFLAGLFSAALVNAEDLTAEQIVAKSLDREKGQNKLVKLEMLLKKGSKARKRAFTQWQIQTPTGSKSLARFTEPAQMKGTAFLSWEHKDRDDDQWLFMASRKQVRRIAASDKTSAFLGSNLSYEDMGEQQASDRTHELLATPLIDGKQTWLIESTAKPGLNSGYVRTRTWVIQDAFVPLKIEMYDKKDQHVKTLDCLEYKEVQGIWTMTKIRMTSVKKGTSTELVMKSVEYGVDIPASKFSKDALKKF